jgi:CTP synthase
MRIVELADHPFYVATLFLPQKRSAPGHPHPVLAGFAVAVAAAR